MAVKATAANFIFRRGENRDVCTRQKRGQERERKVFQFRAFLFSPSICRRRCSAFVFSYMLCGRRRMRVTKNCLFPLSLFLFYGKSGVVFEAVPTIQFFYYGFSYGGGGGGGPLFFFFPFFDSWENAFFIPGKGKIESTPSIHSGAKKKKENVQGRNFLFSFFFSSVAATQSGLDGLG